MNRTWVQTNILLSSISIFLVTGFTTRIRQPIKHQISQPNKQHRHRNYNLLAVLGDDKDVGEQNDNFDGKGLANYLAPYALTFLISIAVTAGFVKYVLMDY